MRRPYSTMGIYEGPAGWMKLKGHINPLKVKKKELNFMSEISAKPNASSVSDNMHACASSQLTRRLFAPLLLVLHGLILNKKTTNGLEAFAVQMPPQY